MQLEPETINNDNEYKYSFMHLAGALDFERVKKYYQTSGVPGKVFSFCDDMERIYAQAHIVIARAGAVTLAEANIWGLPLVLFPLVPSIYDHQRKSY